MKQLAASKFVADVGFGVAEDLRLWQTQLPHALQGRLTRSGLRPAAAKILANASGIEDSASVLLGQNQNRETIAMQTWSPEIWVAPSAARDMTAVRGSGGSAVALTAAHGWHLYPVNRRQHGLHRSRARREGAGHRPHLHLTDALIAIHTGWMWSSASPGSPNLPQRWSWQAGSAAARFTTASPSASAAPALSGGLRQQ
jgi:hypothetical protein